MLTVSFKIISSKYQTEHQNSNPKITAIIYANYVFNLDFHEFIKIHNHFGFSLEITIQMFGKYLIIFH